MADPGISFKLKDLFFDRERIVRAVDRAKRAVLSKAGAFIRTTARHSIRKRKGTSKPGEPPFSHEGSLRRLILFGYDKDAESVVVGPVGFKGSRAPNVLEFGGTTEAPHYWRKRLRKKRIRIRPRRFMGPALEKERPKLPKLWAGSVKA